MLFRSKLARNMLSHTMPPLDELCNTRRFCHAIVHYMEEEEHISATVQEMTKEVLPQIMRLADQDTDDEELDMGVDEYNDILHLCFIPNIIDIVEPYLGLPTPRVPSLLDHIASSPSHITVTDDSNNENKDPNHPGEGWMKYDSSCGFTTPLFSLTRNSSQRWPSIFDT